MRSGGSPHKGDAYLRQCADLFLREAPRRVEDLWAAGEARQWRSAAVTAHALGCLAANVEARELRELAARAERAAGQGNRAVTVLPKILFDLEVAFAETRASLRRAGEGRPA